ncbi:MAG: ribose 5-phosphate isomerase B [Saprospiraceae bacterium]|nr:ribose 5-phosphate isomerase B [Saprospiraceae bacterium]MCB9326087.1 ribose 5-phosphate isomerase B [Lewinellaceae bacterium]
MLVKKIAIGCDHAGFPHKDAVKTFLESLGIEVTDFGTNSADSVDYPDFIHPVAEKVEAGEVDLGVIMCGSGNGAAMTANKHQGIRAALCWKNEIASLARQHNDANVLAIPVRFVSEATSLQMVQIFISTAFEGGRHQRRVDKICL